MRPSIRCFALALLVASAVPAHAEDADDGIEILDVKSNNEDASKLVRNILEHETERLVGCATEYKEKSPDGSGKLALKLVLSKDGGSVQPIKAEDAERGEVRCVGKALAGVPWPKASRKVDLTIGIDLNGG